MNKEIIKRASKQLGLPQNKVWEAYKAYWTFVKQYLSSLAIKGDITKEEFSKLRTSVNIPSLGKFYVDWEHLQAKKQRKQRDERYKDKSTETTIHNSGDNS